MINTQIEHFERNTSKGKFNEIRGKFRCKALAHS